MSAAAKPVATPEAAHHWARCEHPGCPENGLWTRVGDARVLCTQHDREVLMTTTRSPR